MVCEKLVGGILRNATANSSGIPRRTRIKQEEKTMKAIQPTNQELEDILDSLQDQIESARTLQEAETLKGSYGVYLHQLRHTNPTTAQLYIDWMKTYNNTHASMVHVKREYD